MKKRLLSLLLGIVALFSAAFAGCQGLGGTTSSTNSSSSGAPIEKTDYAGLVTLDHSADSITQEVTVKNFVDGDTTHFFFPRGVTMPTEAEALGYFKARYVCVNTPESTGTIEPWGKAASNFTKSKLSEAESIVLETDGNAWSTDSTGDRYLVWVWYKPQGATAYRNLNIELLQEGYAWGSKTTAARYGAVCSQAITQANALKEHVYSTGKDPDFYYGEALEIDLKELRTNITYYNGKRVAFEGTATYYNDWNVYVEDYDADTDRYYGISVFYGYYDNYHSILKPGNRVRIVGDVTYYETGGTYQVSNLKYDIMKPKDPNNIQNLGSGHSASYLETSAADFNSNVNATFKKIDEDTKQFVIGDDDEVVTEVKSVPYASLVLSTTISMKNLLVTDVYTTKSGQSAGAMTLTCKVGNQTISVRTTVLKNADGTVVTKDAYLNKTINVRGIVDYFDGEYQIKVFLRSNITVQE